MTKNVSNKLKLILAGVLLVLVLFNVIAFAVPFNNHFNTTFWVSYIGVMVSLLASFFFLAIPLNNADFNNDLCGNKVSLFTILLVVIQLAAGIVFMAVPATLPSWVAVVVLVAVFVVFVFVLVATLITNASKKEAE